MIFNRSFFERKDEPCHGVIIGGDQHGWCCGKPAKHQVDDKFYCNEHLQQGLK